MSQHWEHRSQSYGGISGNQVFKGKDSPGSYLDGEDQREPHKAAKPCKAASPLISKDNITLSKRLGPMTPQGSSAAEFSFGCPIYILTSPMTTELFVINRILLNLQAYTQMSWPLLPVCVTILQRCPVCCSFTFPSLKSGS